MFDFGEAGVEGRENDELVGVFFLDGDAGGVLAHVQLLAVRHVDAISDQIVFFESNFDFLLAARDRDFFPLDRYNF